jgi:hypothetical protein
VQGDGLGRREVLQRIAIAHGNQKLILWTRTRGHETENSNSQ